MINLIFKYLPPSLVREIYGVCRARSDGASCITEIRLICGGVCRIYMGRAWRNLYFRINEQQMRALVYKLCDGALYSQEESIASGYITTREGVRVGVCGKAHYSMQGSMPEGVSDITSLVFRIPHSVDAAEEVYRYVCERQVRGVLFYAPSGVGKTTALASLASRLGAHRRVVAVDTRCELYALIKGGSVDVLLGYQRAHGIEIAVRTLGADVIILDEIGSDGDVDSLTYAMHSGATVIASTHAHSLSGIEGKPPILRLLNMGVIDTLVGIRLVGGMHSYDISEWESYSFRSSPRSLSARDDEFA